MRSVATKRNIYNLDTDFHLIEAFKFSASDGLVNYHHHRERLAASAASLGLRLDLDTLDETVNTEVADLSKTPRSG